MDFSDSKYCQHFGTEFSHSYMEYRPVYPQTLLDTILSYHKESTEANFSLAVDVACGSGQLTVPLAAHFKQVIGVDISKDMLAVAPRDLPNVRYRETAAEDMAFLQDSSVDMVAVAAALHWLNIDKFIKEVDRILKPGGSFVAFNYYTLGFEHKEADKYMQKFARDLMTKYVDSHRMRFWRGYHGLVTPFIDYRRREDIDMKADWTLDHVIGFYKTLSNTADYVKDNNGSDVFGEVKTEFIKLLCGTDTCGENEKFPVISKTCLVMYRKSS